MEVHVFPNRPFLFPEDNHLPDLLRWCLIALVGVVAVGFLFYFTGSNIFGSALGGLFVLAIVITGGLPELILSVSLMLMLKLGGETAVALIRPWGGGQALEGTLSAVKEASFPQLAVGIFVILFFFLTIPQHVIARWRW